VDLKAFPDSRNFSVFKSIPQSYSQPLQRLVATNGLIHRFFANMYRGSCIHKREFVKVCSIALDHEQNVFPTLEDHGQTYSRDSSSLSVSEVRIMSKGIPRLRKLQGAVRVVSKGISRCLRIGRLTSITDNISGQVPNDCLRRSRKPPLDQERRRLRRLHGRGAPLSDSLRSSGRYRHVSVPDFSMLRSSSEGRDCLTVITVMMICRHLLLRVLRCSAVRFFGESWSGLWLDVRR
jgi:hypothetical protein